MDLHLAMRTTFAAREFVDEPVPDDTLVRILDAARFAPSGGNRQGWRVIAVREPKTKDALAELAVPGMRRYFAQVQAGEFPWNTIAPTKLTREQIEKSPVAPTLLDRFRRAPLLLVVCLDLSVVASIDSELSRVGVISGASIYPFCWNILLAARAEGLGGVITTFATAQEPGVKKLLGIPENFAVAAVMPLGRPVRQLTKLKRKPVREFAFHERFGGPPLGKEADNSRPTRSEAKSSEGR
ncbi:MAG TPA: nitroreductase family protein [Myxococcota bacterium]|nr:nitroreductase family protein [Myxococcota bacterium]